MTTGRIASGSALGLASWSVVLLAIASLASCGAEDRAGGQAWLRTYPATQPTLCTLSIAVDPVIGSFEGDLLADGDKSWLAAADGGRSYVIWPQGFTLSFQPGPVLRDGDGNVVAEKGTSVTLAQVDRSDHSGDMDDPYIALGTVFDRCYALAP